MLVAHHNNPYSKAILFVLLKLTVNMEKHRFTWKLASKYNSQDYALKIAKVDRYLGYLAWSEIYLSQET